MDQIYSFFFHFSLLVSPLIFYIKILFIILLFVLNIYLIITLPWARKEEELDKPVKVLQSGFNIKNLKSVLGNLAAIGGFLSVFITVKNELKDHKIGKLEQLMVTVACSLREREEIRRSIDKDMEEHKRILKSIDNNREELFGLHLDKAKLFGQNDRLLTLHNNLKSNVISYQERSVDPSTKLSDLGIIDQLIKQDTNKFSQELNSIILQIERSYQEGYNESSPLSGGREIENLNEEAIKESIISFPFFKLDLFSKENLDWFESLIVIKKLAVSLIISKSVILSSLISIIFIFYGNIFIERYDLENRFPKIAIFIRLRQKFQKYYFNFYCTMIFIAILTEIVFGIAVLLL